MAMPVNLVLVRHGEAEGNLAVRLSKKGDDRLYTEEFRQRHSSLWRLTDKGIKQAKTAGRWIANNMPDITFDRCYVSEYLRAMETAGHLAIPNARWYVDFYLRERDAGDMDVITHAEKHQHFPSSMESHKRDALYWTPPNGESTAQLCFRIDRVLQTLHRECSDRNVIIVCHGEVIWAFRIRLERMSQSRFYELDQSKDPFDRIHNCQIVHYSRRNPENQQLADHLDWMRSVCPTDTSRSSNYWQAIERNRYSNADLLETVSQTPRLINSEEENDWEQYRHD